MSNPPRSKASDFDPEVLRLFDQYVHGLIDRRGFLAGAARFAVGAFGAVPSAQCQVPSAGREAPHEW